jgi:hypothetical protein
MERQIRQYLAEIGQKGGRKSRRGLTSKQAREMVLVREARRAYRRFYATCFWSYDPNLRITSSDISWVAEQLKSSGDRDAWEAGCKLCL